MRAALVAAAPDARSLLTPLLDYDEVHGGDLLTTLATYLALGCNASASAEKLFLHRSGLLYRLRRIEDLLGLRIDQFQDRVALEVAVLSLGREA